MNPRLFGKFEAILASCVVISVAFLFLFFRLPPISPIAPTTNSTGLDTSSWKTYTTSNYYNLSSNTLNQLSGLTLGNVQFSHPPAWQVQTNFTSGLFKSANLKVADTGLMLLKPNLSKHISQPDAPTTDLVMIWFYLKEIPPADGPLSVTLYENMVSYAERFGMGDSPKFNSLISEKKLAGLPAQFRYHTLDEVDSPQNSFPESILVGISPTTILNINIDFFYIDDDPDYYRETVAEINQILSTLKIIKK